MSSVRLRGRQVRKRIPYRLQQHQAFHGCRPFLICPDEPYHGFPRSIRSHRRYIQYPVFHLLLHNVGSKRLVAVHRIALCSRGAVAVVPAEESHNLGEWFSFLFVGIIVRSFSWQWGFIGAAIAGFIGVALIIFWMHDTPEGCGLPPIEELTGEKKEEKKEETKDVKAIQKQVLRNPGVWILALSSAFMYMSRYAINGWGVLFLQKVKGFDLGDATFIISINAILGVIGTIFSGWISDVAFRGDRKYPAFVAGVLETIALALFLFGGNSWTLNIIAMILFGIAIGVLICFVGGLMAVDIVPREATGAALGVVGMASYLAAGVQDIISGVLIDGNAVETVVDGAKVMSYDFGPVSWFWIAAAAISFILPVFNWKRKVKE